MTTDKLFNVAGLIVGVALVTTLVARRNTASVINAVGSAFSNSISAALGKGVTLQ